MIIGLNLANAKIGLSGSQIRAFEIPTITINSAEKDFANVETTKKELIKLIDDLLMHSNNCPRDRDSKRAIDHSDEVLQEINNVK